jgi:hypothetical protein
VTGYLQDFFIEASRILYEKQGILTILTDNLWSVTVQLYIHVFKDKITIIFLYTIHAELVNIMLGTESY